MDASRTLERFAAENPDAIAPAPAKRNDKRRWTACPCRVCGRRFPPNHPKRPEWEALCPHLRAKHKR